MNVTPIEIHAAAICLDIAAFEDFYQQTEDEILDYFPSIKRMIWEHEFHLNCQLTEKYVDHLANRAVEVLVKCKRGAHLNEASWVIRSFAMEATNVKYLH
ncbi:hypothetical protein [Vibrio mexicanus]|uniref:hypothetical protein n=1 Tax=Vibrio mexicanus TaxID=1004326 RepID=UPI00063C9D28|nr:hypothetical protein [Vibrio mexicanus]